MKVTVKDENGRAKEIEIEDGATLRHVLQASGFTFDPLQIKLNKLYYFHTELSQIAEDGDTIHLIDTNKATLSWQLQLQSDGHGLLVTYNPDDSELVCIYFLDKEYNSLEDSLTDIQVSPRLIVKKSLLKAFGKQLMEIFDES